MKQFWVGVVAAALLLLVLSAQDFPRQPQEWKQ
jgi:hypothetical protein